LRCLESLAATWTDRAGWRVVVVDNASGDGSAELLEREVADRGWAWAEVLRAPRNGGFSAGMNLGLGAHRARAYLLLNSDVELQPEATESMVGVLLRRPRAAVVGPLLVSEGGVPRVSAFRDHTPRRELLGAAATGPLTWVLGGDEVPLPPGGAERGVDWVSFACVLIRGAALDECGVLDPGYFMYYEDAEFCRRVRGRGWEVVYAPAARAMHRGGASGPPPLRLAEAYSRSRYFATFGGRAALWTANLCWTLGRSVSRARELFGRERRYPRGASRRLWAGATQPLRPWEERERERS